MSEIKRINTRAELEQKREHFIQCLATQDKQILICGGTGCTSSNSQKIIEAMEKEIAAQGLAEEVKVVRTGCFGLCALGPIMIVYPEGCFYSRVTVEDVPEIVSEHLLKGRIVTRLLYDETVDKENDTVKSLNETDF